MRSLYLFILLLCINPLVLGYSAQEQKDKIDARLEQLRQTLLARQSPGFLLPPTISEQARGEQSRDAMRPYVALRFEYSLKDIRWRGNDTADLPLRVEWKTAKVDGSLSGTAHFVRIDDEWYFRSFDFLLFPWREVVLASLVAVAFAAVILVLFFRLRRHKATSPASA